MGGPPFGLYVEKIVVENFFGNFNKKSQKWPTQDLSNIERNKVMKNQPIWGIPQGFVYDNQPVGSFTGSSIYIGPFLNDSPFLSQSTQEKVMHFFRKPRILAIGRNYETKSKYVMGGSK